MEPLMGNADLNISLNQLKPLNLPGAGKNNILDENAAGDVIGQFGSALKQEMDKINTLQTEANQAVETYASGGNIELHNVITAVEKADMSLQLGVQVRNRLIAGYQELWRMQI